MSRRFVTLRFDLDRLTWVIVATAILVAAFQVSSWFLDTNGWRPQLVAILEIFDTNGALTFNAWFSALVIAWAAVGTWAAARRVAGRGVARRLIVLSLLMLYMSLDKATAIHQHVGFLLPRFIDVHDPRWVFLGVLALVVVVVYLGGLLWSLPPAPRGGLALGGALFLFGALILNAIGDASHTSSAFHALSIAEELAETLGMVMLARTFFLTVRDGPDGFTISDVVLPAPLSPTDRSNGG